MTRASMRIVALAILATVASTALLVPPARAADPTPPKDAKSRADVLLDDDLPSEQPTTVGLRGYDQFEAAYTLPSPGHWSKLKDRLELDPQGSFSDSLKWRAGVRANVDAVYLDNRFYPGDVRENQRAYVELRENYVDASLGNVDLRVGRQQIVWGEVVGLFFADVVSARDLREFILPDFDVLRIPQWSTRAEYFMGDVHLEAIWIPVPTVDEIGKPGGAFYPALPLVPGYGYRVETEQKPHGTGDGMNYGARVSALVGGYDGALFAYRSVDAQATFLRRVVPGPTPTLDFTPVHEKVTQYGGTIAKDFGDFVAKAEAVYAIGRNFTVPTLADADGVAAQNYLDYIVSAEFALPREQRLNFQFFQRRFTNYDSEIIPRRIESGASVYWAGKYGRFAPEILAIHSLNRNDWLLRPKLVYNFATNWRAAAGADVFGGHADGLFGQYDKQDRIYVEVRRSF